MGRGIWNRIVGAFLVVLGLVSSGVVADPSVANAGPSTVAGARQFLYRMMDLHAVGTVPRLVQSFTGGPLGTMHFTDSETYDDAVIIYALLADGTPANRTRAQTIATALLLIQHNDPARDGRVRVAYAPDPLNSPSDIKATDRTSDVGNMAWVGMAFARLAAVTHDVQYLEPTAAPTAAC